MTFDDAFEKLIGHEGGYSNDPRDRGGETMYGISKRAFPLEDIKGMTLDRAKAIYKKEYWGPAGCDAVPPSAKFDLFDTAVNSGVNTAIRLLQKAVGETADGILGPRTLQAVQSMPAERLKARYNAQRLLFMTEAVTWPVHGKGWVRRVAANLLG